MVQMYQTARADRQSRAAMTSATLLLITRRPCVWRLRRGQYASTTTDFSFEASSATSFAPSASSVMANLTMVEFDE